MKNACILLCQTKLKLSAIASAVGYESEYSFSNMFKKILRNISVGIQKNQIKNSLKKFHILCREHQRTRDTLHFAQTSNWTQNDNIIQVVFQGPEETSLNFDALEHEAQNYFLNNLFQKPSLFAFVVSTLSSLEKSDVGFGGDNVTDTSLEDISHIFLHHGYNICKTYNTLLSPFSLQAELEL